MDGRYDIFIVAGGINSMSSTPGYEELKHYSDPRIHQFEQSAFGGDNIYLAKEPLKTREGASVPDNGVGFPLMFAKDLIFWESSDNILLVPFGHKDDSFLDWLTSETKITNLVTELTHLLTYPTINGVYHRLRGFIYQGFEADVVQAGNNTMTKTDYENKILEFVTKISEKLTALNTNPADGENVFVPCILGFPSNNFVTENGGDENKLVQASRALIEDTNIPIVNAWNTLSGIPSDSRIFDVNGVGRIAYEMLEVYWRQARHITKYVNNIPVLDKKPEITDITPIPNGVKFKVVWNDFKELAQKAAQFEPKSGLNISLKLIKEGVGDLSFKPSFESFKDDEFYKVHPLEANHGFEAIPTITIKTDDPDVTHTLTLPKFPFRTP